MIQFHVEGMHCSGCVRRITQAIHDHDPDAVVLADLESGQVSIGSHAPAAFLRQIVATLGYRVHDFA